MRALIYVPALIVLTGWHAGLVLMFTLFRVTHRAGGVYDRNQRRWAKRLLWITGIRAELAGAEHLPATPAVFVSNHVSFVDIWALLALLPGSLRFVFKREFLYFPVMGVAMRSMGHIAIDRAKRSAAFAAYDQAAAAIRSGISAVVFAEGTRSRDGKLKPFKKGPFVLAIAAQAPVVPVYCDQTYERMPKGSVSPRPGRVIVRVAPPISTTGLAYEDRDDLAERAAAAVIGLGATPVQSEAPGPA